MQHNVVVDFSYIMNINKINTFKIIRDDDNNLTKLLKFKACDRLEQYDILSELSTFI